MQNLVSTCGCVFFLSLKLCCAYVDYEPCDKNTFLLIVYEYLQLRPEYSKHDFVAFQDIQSRLRQYGLNLEIIITSFL